MARGRGQGRPWRGRGSGGSLRGGRATGAPRNRGPFDLHARPSSHTIAKSFHRTNNLPWQGIRATGLLSGLDTGTKLFVSNLDIVVSNDDIRELFSEMGELIRYAIHYDKYGRTSGSAEVVFARRSDALKAVKRYNNVLLDGRPMKIEVIGSKAEFPLLADVKVVGGASGRQVLVNQARGPAWTKGASGGGAMQGSGQRGGGRLRNRRGRRQGQGRGWKKAAVDKSADDLEIELDNYNA
nr:THO complex subunit 4D [Ipomoea batatas]